MNANRSMLLEQAVGAVRRAEEHHGNPGLLHDLVRGISDPRLAAAVYQVSLISADESRPAHRVYLEDLAEALNLSVTLVRKLRQSGRSCIVDEVFRHDEPELTGADSRERLSDGGGHQKYPSRFLRSMDAD